MKVTNLWMEEQHPGGARELRVEFNTGHKYAVKIRQPETTEVLVDALICLARTISSASCGDASTATIGDSKGDWFFERSSGYPGYRCWVCMTWIHADRNFECKCGSNQ